jgi:hypothetical protein
MGENPLQAEFIGCQYSYLQIRVSSALSITPLRIRVSSEELVVTDCYASFEKPQSPGIVDILATLKRSELVSLECWKQVTV